MLVSVIEALQVVGFGGSVFGPNPPSIALDSCLEFVEADKRCSNRRDGMEKRFVGKVAFVTGATTGIGQAEL
jgi:hypothetical protein